MNLLPKSSGGRPRLACEILPSGVVAGRSPEPGLPIAAVAKVDLRAGAIVPSLKPGNIADRVAVIAALRRTLEAVGGRSNARNADLTLVLPDAAVRVLLLDFDSLPTKLSEALPIVRFRLKKLVPFDADDAMVSFQIMSTSRAMIRVLAVAIPRDVLGEYESAVREAGFEPGAVLPSTLAALAALSEGEGAALVVNAHAHGVTTAIVRAGIVLLHRAMELAEFDPPTPATLPPALFEPTPAAAPNGRALLPLVDRDSTEAEWAAQQPLPQYGRNPYADGLASDAPNQDQDATTGLVTPPFVPVNGRNAHPDAPTFDMYAAAEAAPPSRSPYASPMLQQQLDAQFHNAVYVTPETLEALADPERLEGLLRDAPPAAPAALPAASEPRVHTLAPDVHEEEIARAVSVAVAYFEDSLSVAPEILLSAGPLGAENLNRILREQGIVEQGGVRVRDLIEPSVLAPDAASAAVPRNWLAGVTGALRS